MGFCYHISIPIREFGCGSEVVISSLAQSAVPYLENSAQDEMSDIKD